MKIALISDIHANLPALESVLADIDSREVDALYCLGDLVGYHVWPNEVVNLIRKRNIPCISGNYDFGVGRTSDDCGCAYKTDEDRANGKVSISLTNQWIHDDERNYLRNLPAHIRLEFQFDSGPITLLLVHGSPRKNNEYLFEDREEKSLLRIMKDAHADIMCFGHTHKPYHRILTDDSKHLHAINIGSVGKPKDGNPKANYVILNLNENSGLLAKDAVEVEFIKVNYDIEYSASKLEETDLPKAFARMLREGQ
jgi:putative phosphoesterase